MLNSEIVVRYVLINICLRCFSKLFIVTMKAKMQNALVLSVNIFVLSLFISCNNIVEGQTTSIVNGTGKCMCVFFRDSFSKM